MVGNSPSHLSKSSNMDQDVGEEAVPTEEDFQTVKGKKGTGSQLFIKSNAYNNQLKLERINKSLST